MVQGVALPCPLESSHAGEGRRSGPAPLGLAMPDHAEMVQFLNRNGIDIRSRPQLNTSLTGRTLPRNCSADNGRAGEGMVTATKTPKIEARFD